MIWPNQFGSDLFSSYHFFPPIDVGGAEPLSNPHDRAMNGALRNTSS